MHRTGLHKKILCVSLLMLGIAEFFACNHSSLISPNKEPFTSSNKEEYVKDELIVKFKEDVAEGRIKEITTSLGCEIIRSIGPTKTFLVKIKSGEDVKKVMEEFKKFNEVAYAQPNYIYHTLEGK